MPQPARLALVLALLLGAPLAPLAADKPQPPPAPPVPPVVPAGPGETQPEALPEQPEGERPAEPMVGRVTGQDVNLRVHARVDNMPIVKLARGTVLVVVETLPGWYGVRVPMGFPVAVSGEHVARVGDDEVRVKPSRLNVRVQPPEEGRPMPAAFRDPFRADQLLTLIREERGWAWVLAPEELQAYVSQDYVELLGPLSEHAAAVIEARDARARQVAEFKQARAAAAAAQESLALRTAIGEAQQQLYRLRLEGGTDKVPVALAREPLEKRLAAAPNAPPYDRSLAELMLEDLAREMELREARAQAMLAKARGTPPPAVPLVAPQEASVEVEGTLVWEAVPGWKDGGVFVLKQDGKPKRVLRLTTGGPLPLPDLKAACDGKVWRFRGGAPGERVLGLPVVDVREVLPLAPR